MPRGRPRKPAIVQEASGAWRKNPQRRRRDAVSTDPLDVTSAPTNFCPQEREAWDEIVSAAPENVLRHSDRFVVEAAAKLQARLRHDTHFGITLAQRIQIIASLRQLLSMMGMTPSDRARVSAVQVTVVPEDDVNDFSMFR